jgi:hypothetical protein
MMKRHLPVVLLDTLEFWLMNCRSCIKWGDVMSPFYKIDSGVRQGSVLSPLLFAIYINDMIVSPIIGHEIYTILYADDIILLAPSLYELQKLLSTCEQELNWLDMAINVNKSCCMRIGPRCDAKCANITTSTGHKLPWVDEIKYLGVCIVRSRHFKCSWVQARKGFYRSLNAIFGRVGRVASEEVVLQLINSKCLPVLLYGVEACPLNKSDINSMDFAVNRFMMKLFKCTSIEVIRYCQYCFGFSLPSEHIAKRTTKFLVKYRSCNNFLCNFFSD